jgi:hypothetical protein
MCCVLVAKGAFAGARWVSVKQRLTCRIMVIIVTLVVGEKSQSVRA